MPLSLMILIALMAGVVAVLFWGLITMARGGEYNIKWSNKIMRWRIILQALAVLVFVIILLFGLTG